MNRGQMAELLLAGLKERAHVDEVNGLEHVTVDGEIDLLDLADEVLEAVAADLAQRSREGMARNAAKPRPYRSPTWPPPPPTAAETSVMVDTLRPYLGTPMQREAFARYVREELGGKAPRSTEEILKVAADAARLYGIEGGR